MPYGTPPRAQQLVEHGRFNRFLATLPPPASCLATCSGSYPARLRERA
jgi:hypothetical protein